MKFAVNKIYAVIKFFSTLFRVIFVGLQSFQLIFCLSKIIGKCIFRNYTVGLAFCKNGRNIWLIGDW